MNIIQAYINGLKSAGQSKRIATLIYIITLFLGLIVAIPFFQAFKAGTGDSLLINSLLKDFDFTAFTEAMRHGGSVFKTIAPHGIWIGLFFIILSIFLIGGILKTLNQKPTGFSMNYFFDGCGSYFFRFLRLTFYMIIIHIIIALIVFLFLGLILEGAYKTVESEKGLFYIGLTGGIIYLLLFIFLIIITDYAKIILVKDRSRKVLVCMWRSIKFVIRHFLRTYGLYLLLLIAPVLLFFIYFILNRAIGMSSGITILIMFIIQQIFIWSRAWIRIWILGSQLEFYSVYHEN